MKKKIKKGKGLDKKWKDGCLWMAPLSSRYLGRDLNEVGSERQERHKGNRHSNALK